MNMSDQLSGSRGNGDVMEVNDTREGNCSRERRMAAGREKAAAAAAPDHKNSDNYLEFDFFQCFSEPVAICCIEREVVKGVSVPEMMMVMGSYIVFCY